MANGTPNKFKTYHFQEIKTCEMCGEDTIRHRVMGQRLNKSQGAKPGKSFGVSVSVMQCNNCGLIYSQPQPIPNDIQDHYGIPPADYWKKEDFDYNQNYFQGELKAVKSLLKTSNNKALDIGAGLGKAMLAMENAGFDTYGLEPSLPFYERAISVMGISNEN